MSEPEYVTDAMTCRRCGISVKSDHPDWPTYRHAVCRMQVIPHPDLPHDWIATPRSTVIVHPEPEPFAAWLPRNLTIA